MKKKKHAFTLAEALITLAIIGVIAALTTPTLVRDARNTQYKTAYKKAFSVASQVWLKMNFDGLIVTRPGWNDLSSVLTNFSAFKTYFNIIKDCNTNNNSTCWATGETIWGGCPGEEAPAFIDASGMAWTVEVTGSVAGPFLLVDVNGNKGPNVYGKDRFMIIPTPDDGGTIGLPTRILPVQDYATSDGGLRCPTGPCWYTSWITN